MERVEGVLTTPDRYWRVEVIRQGRDRWYRIWHANTVVAPMAALGTVQFILGDAFADLQQVDGEPGAA